MILSMMPVKKCLSVLMVATSPLLLLRRHQHRTNMRVDSNTRKLIIIRKLIVIFDILVLPKVFGVIVLILF